MRSKMLIGAIVIFLGPLLIFPPASAEVFKWVDDKGTIHFTEDESAVPERYQQQTEKRPLPEDPGSPGEKVKEERHEKKGSTGRPPAGPKEKQQVNVKKIESDVADSFKNILSLWKDRKYDALYDCGDRKSRTRVARGDFGRKMAQKNLELAPSWETVRDIEVDVKHATLAYARARIGFKPKEGGETRVRNETYEMRLERGTWRVDLAKLLQSRK
jgi:uncharacterized protein (DUF4415 family)